MEVRLLGPVELRAVDRVLDLGPPKERAVLAALAVDAALPVDVETLVDRVWGDNPPVNARSALYAHITRLRRVLAQAGGLESTRVALAHGSAGYTLDLDRDRVDLHRFRRLVAEGHGQPERDDARLALLREAVGLWYGTPLAGVQSPWASRIRDSWGRLRVEAVVSWARAELSLGNHDEVLAYVSDVIDEYPLVEPVMEVLIRALYAAGRRAEALACYAAARRRFAEELGVEPTAELQALHHAILRGEPDPARYGTEPSRRPGQPAGRAASGQPETPTQLPTDVRAFTGRHAELARLDALAAASGLATSVVITAVSGTAGSARPRSRCTGHTGPPAGSRMGSCT